MSEEAKLEAQAEAIAHHENWLTGFCVTAAGTLLFILVMSSLLHSPFFITREWLTQAALVALGLYVLSLPVSLCLAMWQYVLLTIEEHNNHMASKEKTQAVNRCKKELLFAVIIYAIPLLATMIKVLEITLPYGEETMWAAPVLIVIIAGLALATVVVYSMHRDLVDTLRKPNEDFAAPEDSPAA